MGALVGKVLGPAIVRHDRGAGTIDSGRWLSCIEQRVRGIDLSARLLLFRQFGQGGTKWFWKRDRAARCAINIDVNEVALGRGVFGLFLK